MLLKCPEEPIAISYLFARLFHITSLNFQWFTLDEVSKGKLHLKLEWLTLMPTADNLDKVLKEYITFILNFIVLGGFFFVCLFVKYVPSSLAAVNLEKPVTLFQAVCL